MSSDARMPKLSEVTTQPARVSGEPQFNGGALAEERGTDVLAVVNTMRNRIGGERMLSQLGLQNFSLFKTGQPGQDTNPDLSLKERSQLSDSLKPTAPTITNDDMATEKRIWEGTLKNLTAAQFLEDRANELAFAKAGAGWGKIDLERAIQEILQNKWCMGAHDTTYEDIQKDWDVLKKFGVTEKDVQNIINQAQEKSIPGGTRCLVG